MLQTSLVLHSPSLATGAAHLHLIEANLMFLQLPSTLDLFLNMIPLAVCLMEHFSLYGLIGARGKNVTDQIRSATLAACVSLKRRLSSCQKK